MIMSLQNHKNIIWNQIKQGWNANNLNYTINKNMFVFCTKIIMKEQKCNELKKNISKQKQHCQDVGLVFCD